MKRSIIDPSTLTEEQSEAIKGLFNHSKEVKLCLCVFKYRLINFEDVENAFNMIFGKDFFRNL